MPYFFYSISVMMISWIIGASINNLIKKKVLYKHLSFMHWIKSDTVNRVLGIYVLKFLVTHTWYRRFVPGPKASGKSSIPELLKMRQSMTDSEIGHLIGFIVILITVLVLWITGFQQKFIPFLLAMNVFLNLYPSLLQQFNKNRIDQIMMAMNA